MASDQQTTVSRADAVRLGLKRYFDGKLCKRGHVAERNTASQQCVECAGMAARKWGRRIGPPRSAARRVERAIDA